MAPPRRPPPPLPASKNNNLKKSNPPPPAQQQQKRRKNGFSGGGAAARSAYFARREAAKVLRAVLQGDARRRAVGTIKSLVYAPSVRNKKATFALVCQTLKYLPVLKDVLEAADVLTGKWKRQLELIYVTAYDMLFGQKSAFIEGQGPVEKFLALREKALDVSLAQLLVRKKAKCPEDLLLSSQTSVVSRAQYVRVNTLKLDIDSAIQRLEKEYKVKKDDMVPQLLVLPAGTDLHDHPLVVNGSIFMQGKASSMPAIALSPQSGWKVLDACAAPGNKTIHLAALMNGKGKVIACELNENRVRHLEETIRQSGASNVTVFHCDFLDINPMEDPLFSEVQAILLDPSCSGSGTSIERLDHLLPSNSEVNGAEMDDSDRIMKLAAFQRKALAHALSFPAVERIVYSTCSIHQMENEDVVMSVLPLATSLNFELVAPFPDWPHRGLPVFQGSEKVLRTNPAEGMEGFFVALFVRKKLSTGHLSDSSNSSHWNRIPEISSHITKSSKEKLLGPSSKKKLLTRKTSPLFPCPCRMNVWLHLQMLGRKKRRLVKQGAIS